ncbi:MAG: PP2C family protein-serine/threonine phosphatase [Chloroflexi bacterium]|nr:PP2C family protein-serine/threonine phosphatase [Chloroflexota bacterium]
MNEFLTKISRRLHPNFDSLGTRNIGLLADTLAFLMYTPLALIGVVWLVLETDKGVIQREWPMLLTLLFFIALAERLDFFLALSMGTEQVSTQGSLSPIITWSGVLLFGPTVFWLQLIVAVGDYFFEWWRAPRISFVFWNLIRRFLGEAVSCTVAGLLALGAYKGLGGEYPLPSLKAEDFGLGLVAVLIHIGIAQLFDLPYTIYILRQILISPEFRPGFRNVLLVVILSMATSFLIEPFGILGAGVYAGDGYLAFLMFATGLSLICVLLYRLSKSVDSSQQRSREMELLEHLGRDIISGPPDASTLPEILKAHVPPMFLSSAIHIHLYPDQRLLDHVISQYRPDEAFWNWLKTQTEPVAVKAKERMPWADRPALFSILTVPILDMETRETIGGIYFSGLRIGKMDRFKLPIQSLAAQVASALHSAKVYRETLSHQKTMQELAFAGKVQASFLPSHLPQVEGWQLAATIDSARETCGDFYDLINFPDGKIGFVVADVADKGTGAALFMALSRTLIRTYAFEYPDEPATVLRAANERILQDTRTNLFVTVFYGVLNPIDGLLTYASAGHNPAFVLNVKHINGVQKLARTGIPMGMFDTGKWKQQTCQLSPADVLIMYTDGVTEAQDISGNLYSEDRLLKVIRANPALDCDNMRDTVVTDIHEFVGDAPQSDDITLMLVMRNPN